MAATSLILHLSRAKLARIERRAAELGRDASGYVAGLINQDLKQAAKADLNDLAPARDSMKGMRVTPQRSRRREKIRKSLFESAAKAKTPWPSTFHIPHHD